MQIDDIHLSFWSHLHALKKTCLFVSFVIATGVFLSFIFYEPIFNYLTFSLKNQNPNASLVLLSPLEGMLSVFQVSFWAGVTLTSPIWLFFIMRFISPGLYKHEKQLIFPFFGLSFIFITFGVVFAIFITIPFANHYLSIFNQSLGINLWSLKHYLDYTLFLILANGFAFELGVLGVFAVHLDLISANWLIEKRKMAIVFAFILGALLTPPDVLTQVLMALPLIGIYEFMIIYAKLKKYVKFNRG